MSTIKANHKAMYLPSKAKAKVKHQTVEHKYLADIRRHG